jgi:hypothetical protein
MTIETWSTEGTRLEPTASSCCPKNQEHAFLTTSTPTDHLSPFSWHEALKRPVDPNHLSLRQIEMKAPKEDFEEVRPWHDAENRPCFKDKPEGNLGRIPLYIVHSRGI